eukprot:TRINITY_DN57895_c0_g1_i1.p1 TRINITY_DN57895_c0_g1~~TRINITY_DN57895_c0_g1_i1.p1  ORF type:complete len:1269 (+),score=213.64 TRINITY_DN57895_c0_g1_i1:62-3868(+)
MVDFPNTAQPRPSSSAAARRRIYLPPPIRVVEYVSEHRYIWTHHHTGRRDGNTDALPVLQQVWEAPAVTDACNSHLELPVQDALLSGTSRACSRSTSPNPQSSFAFSPTPSCRQSTSACPFQDSVWHSSACCQALQTGTPFLRMKRCDSDPGIRVLNRMEDLAVKQSLATSWLTKSSGSGRRRVRSQTNAAGARPSSACDRRKKQNSSFAKLPAATPGREQTSGAKKGQDVRLSLPAPSMKDNSSSNPWDDIPGWDPNALARSIHPLPASNPTSPSDQPRRLRRQLTCQSEASGWLGGTRSLSAASGLGDLTEVCPRSPEDVLALQTAHDDGFSTAELGLMRRAFNWFLQPEASEIAKDSLLDAFIHLGYLGPIDVLTDALERISSRMSPYSSFSFTEFIDIAEQLTSEEALRIRSVFQVMVERDNSRFAFENGRVLDSSVPELLRSLGLLPLNNTVSEIILSLRNAEQDCCISDDESTPDGDGGGLDFEFFERFLAAYRAAEGFNREALSHAASIFQSAYSSSMAAGVKPKMGSALATVGNDPSQPEKLLHPSLLAGILVRFFGRQSEMSARALLRRAGIACKASPAPSRAGKHKHEKKTHLDLRWQHEPSTPQGRTSGFGIADFIIWARRLRELRLYPLWQRFRNAALNALPYCTNAGDASSWSFRLALCDLPATMGGSTLKPEDHHAEHLGSVVSERLQVAAAETDAAVIAASSIPEISLSYQAVEEFIERAGLEDKTDLDFDEFVRFAQACFRRSGFTTSEADEFKEIFKRFDHDESGELEAVEFLDLLRYLGHNTCLEDVYRFIDSVDCDRSGTLDFKEFMRQMRLHWEEEWRRIRQTFRNELAAIGAGSEDMGESTQVPCSQLPAAFHRLGVLPQGEEAVLSKLLEEAGSPEAVDVHTFAQLAARCRVQAAANLRRQAGFSGAQLSIIRNLFDLHCESATDELSRGELFWLLISIGVPVNTIEARQDVLSLLEEVRTAARQAGMSSEELGDRGSSATPFWAFVHLLRALNARREGTAAEKELRAIDNSCFSTAEVAEFREIFLKSAASSQEDELEGKAAGNSIDNCTEPLGVEGPAADVQKAAAELAQMLIVSSTRRAPTLSLQEFKSLLRSIGLKFNIEQREVLNRKVSDVLQLPSQRDQDLAVGTKSATPRMDFAEFLRLMRWMLDDNFAGINEVAKRTAEMKLQRIGTTRLGTESKEKKKLKLSSAARTVLSVQASTKIASKDAELLRTNKTMAKPEWPLRIPRGGPFRGLDSSEVSST